MPDKLDQLLNAPDPAWPLVQQFVGQAPHPVEILPADRAQGEKILLSLQINVHSFMGAIALHAAGLLIDRGWLRILGAGGHPRLQRSLPGWNVEQLGHATGILLIADDALGGFFAVDGGALGPGKGAILYLPPDRLEWEPFAPNYTEFFRWALKSEFGEFYKDYRWDGWEKQVAALTGDQALNAKPYLFTQEARDRAAVARAPVAVGDLFELYALTLPTQLGLTVPDCLK